MPKNITLYKIFLASPGDLLEERLKVEEVVAELNYLLEKRNIKLDLIKWETHSYPSMGKDAQDVVNTQVKDDYDVFIGIMWSKFGTPTNRADSGTEEEFNRAYSRYLKRPNSVRIMFYFNNKPVPINEIHPDQIAKVLDFKTKLSEKGALYWEYKNVKEFERDLRLHLKNVINELEEINLLSTRIDKSNKKEKRSLALKSYNDYQYLDTEDIVYLKADNNSTDFFMKDGSLITTFKTLGSFEKALPPNFFRAHNSYIVNGEYITRINYGKSILGLKNMREIPFSKTYRQNVDYFKNKKG
nr:LytTR family transcriptional regulator DNA-binding domain-containing protein [uncultured Allomuricauda sp.]